MGTQTVALGTSLRESGLIGSFGTKLRVIQHKQIELIDGLLEIMADLDPTDRVSWRSIVVAAGEAGVSDEKIQLELGTSPSTIYRWRQDDVAPRAGTRKLMKEALIRLVREHRKTLDDEARIREAA